MTKRGGKKHAKATQRKYGLVPVEDTECRARIRDIRQRIERLLILPGGVIALERSIYAMGLQAERLRDEVAEKRGQVTALEAELSGLIEAGKP